MILYKHTGLMDSNLLFQDNYIVLDADPNPSTISATFNNTWNYYQRWEYYIVHTGTLSLDSAIIVNGIDSSDLPLITSTKNSKTQYLWTAAELTAAGLSAGDITGFKLFVATPGMDARLLSIRMKHTGRTTLVWNNHEVGGFTTTYSQTTSFNSVGWKDMSFTAPFNWDGVSNIAVEFCYSNILTGSPPLVLAETPAFNPGVNTRTDDDQFLDLTGDYLRLDDFAMVIDSTDKLSFFCWLRTTDGNGFALAVNSSSGGNVALFGVNNNRLTMHIGSYNDATTIMNDGEWHHVGFTYDMFTNDLIIYLDGLADLVHNQEIVFDANNRISIGQEWDGSNPTNFLTAAIDEVSIWNTVLTQTEVQSYMNRDIDPSHPQYHRLMTYYNFNEGVDTIVPDHGSTRIDADVFNNPVWTAFEGCELWRNMEDASMRPNATFIQGTFNSYIDSNIITDSIPISSITVVLYEDTTEGNIAIPTDTIELWASGFYSYTYDPTGNLIDSSFIQTDTTMNLITRSYYDRFEVVIPYEMGRFVPPRGNGLDLGDGFTWTWDVTDFSLLLHDSVDLKLGHRGYIQTDAKFIMIEGTPPRDVVEITPIWNGYEGNVRFQDLADDLILSDTAISLHPFGRTFKYRSLISGHGTASTDYDNQGNAIWPHCCESWDNTHYLSIDGQPEANWHVWQTNDCAMNPLYPQGGDWTVAHEGWCPGSQVTVNEYEIEASGSSVNIDYDISDVPSWETGLGDGEYLMSNYLVQYGSSNFSLDAELLDIINPNNNDIYSRSNPMCSDIKVVIRNAGSTPMTSVNITYWVSGGLPNTIIWTGKLNFMETEEVVLPTIGAYIWFGDGKNRFTATVSYPNNGGTDLNPENDSYSTNFEMPEVQDTVFILAFGTNNVGSENSWEIIDHLGEVIYQRNDMSSNTLYLDTISLAEGCYDLHVHDIGNNGLYHPAEQFQGIGSIQLITAGGSLLRNFESDFGRSLHYAFSVGGYLGVEESKEPTLAWLYPNPNNGSFTLQFNSNQQRMIHVRITDISGRTIYEQNLPGSYLTLDNIDPGLYLIKINDGFNSQVLKMIVQR